jgi:DNA polymerase V
MKVTEIYDLEQRTKLELPLFLVRVPAGYPSPGDDYIERKLDLNELIKHPEATFLVKVEGDSMINAGINSGDILVVDRAVEPTHNKIVVAYLNGELTVKRLKIENTKIYLVADNPDYKPIRITPLMAFEVRGVVTTVIHKL